MSHPRLTGFLAVALAMVTTLPPMADVAPAGTVAIEDLTLNRDLDDSWALAGLVRNLGSKPISGYVRIKFLDANGDIRKSASAFVNDLDPIQPGQAGPFEYWTDASDFDGIESYNVTFRDM